MSTPTNEKSSIMYILILIRMVESYQTRVSVYRGYGVSHVRVATVTLMEQDQTSRLIWKGKMDV